MTRPLTFAKAINEALFQAMSMDESVISYGLGVDDPKGVFGTTLGLQKKYGSQRVFDMPTSENAMTGVAIGAALNGMRPVMSHQRVDFFLLAMDQLINNAAKWHYMFSGQSSVPITIRLIIGRGWGQGPTHSQNLQALFAHIPGLKVVMPTTAADAKGLLLASIFDDNPVIFMEHRWLHNLQSDVPAEDYRVPIGKARKVTTGNDLTIVAMSYMTIEATHAVETMSRQGVSCDLIDLRSVKPVDWEAVFASVRKTGRLLALDTDFATGSIGSEIISRTSQECFDSLKQAPRLLALPDFPAPTSPALKKVYYKRAEDIVTLVAEMLDCDLSVTELLEKRTVPLDVPGEWFKGPF